MLRPFAYPVACYWMLLRVVAQSLKAVKLSSQQLPTFLLFRGRRGVAQQCWIRLHSSSNIVGASHAYYAWFTKTYGLLILPTMHCRSQQSWELLRPFACSLRVINFKFLLLISPLYKIERSSALRTWSHKMNSIDTSTNSPHYFYWIRIGITNENSNFYVRV